MIFQSLSRIPKYMLFRKFNWPRVFPSIMTLSVTDKCNSRCLTCNIWKKRPKNELTLEEYKKIFDSLDRLLWVTITGGEPFLRKDISQIIKLLNEKTKPKLLTIATNGILTHSILSTTKEVLNTCPNLNVIVNLSLDGIGKEHDKIRGVKGNFKKTIETFKQLKKIKNKRLTVGINTVVSKYNVKDFPRIYEYIEGLEPDSFVVEIAEKRAKLYNLNSDVTPQKKDYAAVLAFLVRKSKTSKIREISELVRKLRIEFYKSLLTDDFPKSYEGIASAYIMANGEVWVSYSKRYVLGNLRNVDYDFRRLWFSEKAKRMRKHMESEDYKTMLANAFYTNVFCNPRRLLKVLLS